MARVIGIGGVFFKSADPEKLYDWYVEHLGVRKNDGPGVSFMNSDQPAGGYLVWGAFNSDTQYFDPATRQYMFNLVVDDLDGALEQVQAGGANGRFGWFMDPDENKVELWEPKL
jgi:predicted enzyme related to lactoylglutathione lyase